MSEQQIPDVKTYLDANQYLRDIYAFKKQCDKTFSYENWARKLDITSKSYLRFAILGQRTISDQLTQKFTAFLNLNKTDAEYFAILVLYTQCSHIEQKKLYGKQLTQLLRTAVNVQELEIKTDAILHPLYIVVRSLLSFSDIERSPAVIANLLNLKLDELHPILQMLEAEGLIYFNGFEWIATHDNVKVADAPGREAILAYHKISLLKAIDAQKLLPEERNYRSLGLALTREEYNEFLQDFDAFAKKIYSKYTSNQFSNRRFYQFNFNLFPWTKQETVAESRAQFVTEAQS